MYERQCTLAKYYDRSWKTIHKHVLIMKSLTGYFPSKCFCENDVDADAFDYYWRNRSKFNNRHLIKTVEPYVKERR